MEPVIMREQSQLNWTLLISPLWPIRVWTRLRKTENAAMSQLCIPVCRIYRCYACTVQYKWWHTNWRIHCSDNDDVWPSWSNIPYSNCVVEGAGDKLISHCVKAQREDLCSVTLDEIKDQREHYPSLSRFFSLLNSLSVPHPLCPCIDENAHEKRNIIY